MSLYTLLWKKRRPDNQNNDIFWRVLYRSQAEHDPVCHLSFASREIAEAQAQPRKTLEKQADFQSKMNAALLHVDDIDVYVECLWEGFKTAIKTVCNETLLRLPEVAPSELAGLL